MKRFVFLVLNLIIPAFTLINAQTIGDALRYSTIEFGATGRAIGAAGSFSALGTDPSLIGSNPAGLAAFRRSEFAFTPGVDIISTKSSLNGSIGSEENKTKSGFSFGNISYITTARPRSRNWKTFNFGLAFNRTATYRQDLLLEGEAAGSIVERWSERSQGFFTNELDDFEFGLAYDALAIYDDPVGSRNYVNDYQAGVLINKSYQREITGGMSEFSISLASNFRDRLFIGGLIGIPFVNYSEKRTYSENDSNDQVPVFDGLDYEQNISTTGAGVNFKFGLIYRLNQMVRFGLAVHSPTRLSLEDTWDNAITYRFTDPDFAEEPTKTSPEGLFEYTLKTPARYIASAGFVIRKKGFVSTEIEYVDYGKAKFDFNTENGVDMDLQDELNENISTDFNSAVNIRVGGEYVLNVFRFRGGVGLIGSGLKEDADLGISYHLGTGFRKNAFFMDLGYKLDTRTNSFLIYEVSDSVNQQGTSDLNKNYFSLTIGFKI